MSGSVWVLCCVPLVRGGRKEGLGNGAVLWRPMGSASMLERSLLLLRFNEVRALWAALIDNGDGCGKLYSPECRTDVASRFWSGNGLKLLFRGVTSLREWLSQWRDVCDGVRCRVLRESSGYRDAVGVDEPTGAALLPLSLERRDVQANVAALLAPGPSLGALGCLARVDFELLSLIL
jgi:hypothetical protein